MTDSKLNNLHNSLIRFFGILAIGGLVAGLIHLISMADGYTVAKISDASINLFAGLLSYIIWRLLKNNNSLSLSIYLIQIGALIAYAMLVSRGINWIVLVIAIAVYWQLNRLRNHGILIKVDRNSK